MFPIDAAAYIHLGYGAAWNALAAGTGDATEKNGSYVSKKLALQGGSAALTKKSPVARTCTLGVCWEATIADTESFTLAGNLQDATSAAGAGVADYGTAAAAATIFTASGAATNVNGYTALLTEDLINSDEFIRGQVTPNLSASGTDDVDFIMVYVFSGFSEAPISAT